MKNTFGNSLQYTIFGESHGPYIGCVLDGLMPGLKIDTDFINHQLDLRRPSGRISTARVEADQFQIASGAYNGYTTGTPLCILIPNAVQHSKDYSKTANLARPGHADFTAECKYKGFQDFRGGGHFSGRITAALVAAGAIVIPALNKKGIIIGSHVKSCGGIEDLSFSENTEELKKQIKSLNHKNFAVIEETSEAKMKARIEEVAAEGDSVGGILETAIVGLPAGVGEPWFDSLESLISHAVFSVPAVKGIQFGSSFDKVNLKGSEYNDEFRMDGDKVITTSNNNAGINGGITNGMPVLFSCAVKPTPSIYKKQNTIDFKEHKNSELQIEGRHDPAIIHRARVVIDSVTALVLYDILQSTFGSNWFAQDCQDSKD